MPAPDWDLSLELRCDRTAPSQMREALSDRLDIGWATGDLMLVASELVSNAVEHSGAGAEDVIEVKLRRSSESVTLAVCDPGISGRKAELRPGPSPFGGLGLRLVDQLSARWGAGAGPRGRYRVWAEIELN